MDKLSQILQVLGLVLIFTGVVSLSFLQLTLGRKLNKNFFTAISIMLHSSENLNHSEKLIKKIGTYTILIGSVIVLLCGFDEIVDSIVHFSDPPEILR